MDTEVLAALISAVATIYVAHVTTRPGSTSFDLGSLLKNG
jgi:hypothetical protein